MRYDSNNPFARILRGELPCVKVSETSSVLAFMDMMPEIDGHVLVVPKEAVSEIFDLPDEVGAACFQMVNRVATAVRDALKPGGILVAQFNGEAAGQTVPHVHFHIIPRHAGKELRLHARVVTTIDKIEAVAQRIRAKL
ncbi:HIT family protein [Candidatus Vallotia cooleyia]|uniref:HIT family protein n=1 Tax=Candidatus Vallotiella adelgis TaxID=1177211 RepID=UPI001D0161E7|nr:HIT domain-containing protein [Candidatus Vallotia cooleyia]UDG82627.1 HIT family protein [Candidatus Vallotia cooleyia]